ncbi:hypothetical protein ACOWMJ_06195 [Helicobacter pylori]
MFYVLKLYLYIKIYKYNLKLYLYVDFMKLLRCFCGKNLEHVKFGSMLGFLVVVGGYRDKAIIISIKKGLGVLSLLGASCKNLIQTGFGRERLRG